MMDFDRSMLGPDDQIWLHPGDESTVAFLCVTAEQWPIEVVSLSISDGSYRLAGSASCPGKEHFQRFADAWARASAFVAANGLVPRPDPVEAS